MSGIDREAEAFESHPKWYLTSRFVLALVIVAVVGVGFTVAGYALNWWAAPYQGKLQARQQINSGDFRIEAYNKFYDLCAAAQTAETVIASQTILLGQYPKSDNADRNRVLTNIAAANINLADTANQYNADARKSYTEGQFRSKNLPFQLPRNYRKGAYISCK